MVIYSKYVAILILLVGVVSSSYNQVCNQILLLIFLVGVVALS